MQNEPEEFRVSGVARDYLKSGKALLFSQIDSIVQKFFLSDEIENTVPFKTFDTRKFWYQLETGNLARGREVAVLDTCITDWIPRWPGVFHTKAARYARKHAWIHLLSENDTRMERWKERDPKSFAMRGSVHDVNGKGAKIKGGVGCVRLASVERFDGRWYLLNAFKADDLETGIPIAVPEKIFDQLTDEINEKGFATGVNITGVLRDAPTGYAEAFLKDKPRYILEVHQITRSKGIECNPTVSVPISFSVEEDDREEIFFSYANFTPACTESYKSAVDFLERIYVGYLYGGRVLTDFDETENRFENAIFSLKSISAGATSDVLVARRLDRALGGNAWRDRMEYAQTIIVERQMNTYKADRGGVVIGPGASAGDIKTDSAVSGAEIDLNALVKELSTLRSSMKEAADDDNATHDLDIGKVAAAEQAAKNGDASTAFSSLKSVGIWGLCIAEKVGVKLATKLITDQLD